MTSTVEVIDASTLSPCPFGAVLSVRHALVCMVCRDTLELFPVPTGALEHESVRGGAVYQAASHEGWLFVDARWCCRECARVALDYESRAVRSAVDAWNSATRIDVRVEPGP